MEPVFLTEVQSVDEPPIEDMYLLVKVRIDGYSFKGLVQRAALQQATCDSVIEMRDPTTYRPDYWVPMKRVFYIEAKDE